MNFNAGDKVYSVYDDGEGIVLEVIPTNGQDFYLVQWKSGKITEVAREEVF